MENKELVYIFDKKQVVAYMKNNVFPIKVELDEKDRIVYGFIKSETKTLYDKWRKHEL